LLNKNRGDGGYSTIIMKKIVLLLLLCVSSLECSEKAVTYTFSGGRFGDNLLSYAHAKWVSYRFEIPLLYKPFPYSDQLMMHGIEHPYHSDASFSKTVHLGRGQEVNKQDPESILYILSYFAEGAYVLLDPYWPYVEVDWEDPGFRALLKEAIQPITPLPKWDLPTDRVTVAAHVRRGGGFDSLRVQKREPLKFPPDTFYIEQIRRIHAHFRGRPLYVFVFTDDPFPDQIVKQFKEQLRDLNVSFGYRKEGNTHHSNVLEDFFAMTQFDCLIRPESNYSRMASAIGDFLYEIYPMHFTVEKRKSYIDKYKILIRGEQ
jgi:hypothetical protein